LRKPLRSLLTVLAIAISFLLFGVMHGVVAQFDEALTHLSDARLRVMSRANMLESIPIAYRQRIAAIDGVRHVSPVTIFFGYYQDPVNSVSGGGVDLDEFLAVMPEIVVPPAQADAMRNNPLGAIVGAGLARKHGWKIGDRIGLKSRLWMNQETGEDWQFEVAAIANAGADDDPLFAQEVYVHYDYLDRARIREQGTVNQFLVTLQDPSRATEIASTIDRLFANSTDETTTVNERDYLRGQISRVGNIRGFVYSILGAVAFTLLFLTATTMQQSLRERIPDLGILKSMGFTDATMFMLIIAEALILCLCGAVLGLVIAGLVFPQIFGAFGLSAGALTAGVYLYGLGLAVLLGVLIAAWPAWRARRLEIVAAIASR